MTVGWQGLTEFHVAHLFADEFIIVCLRRGICSSEVRLSWTFYRQNFAFPWNLTLNSYFLAPRQTHIRWIEDCFQLCTAAPRWTCTRTGRFLYFFFFLSGSRNNAKYAFQYLFKIKTGQYGKRKKRKNKAGAFTTGYLRRITHPNPCQRLLSLGNRQNTTGYTTLNAQFTGNVLPFVMLLEI